MAQRNLITDVAGILVGHADDARLASGVTVIVFEEPAVAAVDVRGGAPGTRETDLLEPHRTAERIDAVVLSGGSAFGLDAGAGVQAFLRERGRGFAIGDIRVPLVCGAVLFDLLNGGDKNWGRFPPYRDLGYSAAAQAGKTFALGTAGAGFGATTVNLKGGLGSASAVPRDRPPAPWRCRQRADRAWRCWRQYAGTGGRPRGLRGEGTAWGPAQLAGLPCPLRLLRK